MSQVRRQPSGDTATEVLAAELARVRRQLAELQREQRARGRFEPLGARQAAAAAIDNATQGLAPLDGSEPFTGNVEFNAGIDLELGSSITNSVPPNDYPNGLSTHLATAGNGFPVTGALFTVNQTAGYSMQFLIQRNTTTPGVHFRGAVSSGAGWSSWRAL